MNKCIFYFISMCVEQCLQYISSIRVNKKAVNMVTAAGERTSVFSTHVYINCIGLKSGLDVKIRCSSRAQLLCLCRTETPRSRVNCSFKQHIFFLSFFLSFVGSPLASERSLIFLGSLRTQQQKTQIKIAT